jgi:DNA uptake protein ComE-like DNA-binding protein
MPLFSNRILIKAALTAITTGLVFAAALVFVRGDDNAPILVVLPTPEMSEGAANTGPEENLRVYVNCAVRNLGVYRLRRDNRLADALSAAGGVTTDANLDAVNLAQRVKDAEQYHIPRVGETPPPGASIAEQLESTIEASCGGLMDLNVASAAQLDTLPGIGLVRANDTVQTSHRIVLEPDLSLEVLNPADTPIGGSVAEQNNNSVVLRLVYGKVSFLLAADIEAEAESYLTRRSLVLDSAVLKVPHHGSKTSTTSAFLARIDPVAVVVSVGEANRFGHPHPEVVDRLSEAVGGDLVYRTDRHGTVEFISDWDTLWARTER